MLSPVFGEFVGNAGLAVGYFESLETLSHHAATDRTWNRFSIPPSASSSTATGKSSHPLLDWLDAES